MKKAAQSGNSGHVGLIFALLMGCLLVFLEPAIFILLAVGMAPSWVAVLVERHNAGRLHTTAALNFAGVLPFLAQVWSAGGGIAVVMTLLNNVFTWAVMYGAAAIGVSFLWIGPQIAALYLDFKATHYSRQLRKQREHLLAEWGSVLDDEAEGASEAGDRAA